MYINPPFAHIKPWQQEELPAKTRWHPALTKLWATLKMLSMMSAIGCGN